MLVKNLVDNRQRTIWDVKSIHVAFEIRMNNVKTNSTDERNISPNKPSSSKKVPKE